MDKLVMIKSLADTKNLISALIENKTQMFATTEIPKPMDELVAAANACVNALQNGNKIFFMGNGGSAAEAQHLAGELVSYFLKQSEPYAAIALNTDTSVITAIANDMGYEHVFSRQLQALSKPGDVAVYLSTSGLSKNILNAMEYGKENGVVNISFTGMKTRYMQPFSDHYIVIPSTSTPHIQEMHLILGHLLCQFIEEKLQPKIKDDF
jgi:D-sedoheptulose 7-phosphate isomerase